MQLSRVVDDALWTIGFHDVAKARSPSPLTRAGFDALVLRVLQAVQRATRADHDEAIRAAIRLLQKDWGRMTADQQTEAFRAALAAYLEISLGSVDRAISAFGQHATTIVASTRSATATQFGLPLNDTFNALDEEVVRHLVNSQALFIRTSTGAIAQSLSRLARNVVASGLRDGLDRADIGELLAKEFRGSANARTQHYYEMVASVFVGRARTYATLRSFEAAEITKYESRAVLDEVTCPACRFMHGRGFEVRRALDQYGLVAQSPAESVADLQPFLRTMRGEGGQRVVGVVTATGTTAIAQIVDGGVGRVDARGSFRPLVGDDTIARLGCNCAPFHPFCRCLKVPVSTRVVQVPVAPASAQPPPVPAAPAPPAPPRSAPRGPALEPGKHVLATQGSRGSKKALKEVYAGVGEAAPWLLPFLERVPLVNLKFGPMRRANGTYGQSRIQLRSDREAKSLSPLVPGKSFSMSTTAPTKEQAMVRTFIHELAHHVHLFDFLQATEEGRRVDDLIRRAYRQRRSKSITEYGRTNDREFWAESMTAYVFAKAELEAQDPDAVDFVESVLRARGILP